jgi:UDP-glucose 6-dehydrogenase
MNVSVFGLGYVGCVTGACLAKAGHRVIGVELQPEKVEIVNAGAAPFVEPGLSEERRAFRPDSSTSQLSRTSAGRLAARSASSERRTRW